MRFLWLLLRWLVRVKLLNHVLHTLMKQVLSKLSQEYNPSRIIRHALVHGIFLLCFFSNHVHGQGDIQDDVRVFYGNEFTVSIAANTNGFGIGSRYAIRKDARTKYFYEFQASNIRHSKEIGIIADVGARLVYGKNNSTYSMAFLYGNQSEKFSKLDKGSVAIRYITFFGAVLGIEKPYYYVVDVNNRVYERFDASTTSKYGRAPFFVGFGEISLVPGLTTGTSVNFEFSNKNKMIQALEFGAQVQVYLRKLEIMYEAQNNFIFPSFFVLYRFGKALTL